jgi:outer membrane protein assembly factor BamB
MKVKNTTRIIIVVSIAALIAISAPSCQSFQKGDMVRDQFPLPGEWLCYRRDGSQQARSPMKGKISKPKLAWKHFAGTIGTLMEVQPGYLEESVSIPLKKLSDAEAILNDPRWGMHPPSGIIAGISMPVHNTTSTSYADIRPDIPGLEKIEFESSFKGSGADGNWPPAGAQGMVWQKGQWHTLWEMPPIYELFLANPLIDDFDADGELEVAFLPWKDLMILDAKTGEYKDSCRFTWRRSYGFFGAYDLDGNGKKEFLVMADFSKHVDVLGYINGKLSILWQKNIEIDISNPQKILRVNSDPACDLDGDGDFEVMLNLYNDAGDGKWHTTIHVGMTGNVVADLSDEHLQGIIDINDDGTAELLTIVTDGNSIPEYGTIRIWSMEGGKLDKLWEDTNACWETWLRPMLPHLNNQAGLGRREVLWREGNEATFVAVRRPADGGQVALSAEIWQDGGLKPIVEINGPSIRTLALDNNGSMLVSAETDPGISAKLSVSNGTGKVLVSNEKPAFHGTPVVAQQKGKSLPMIIVQGHLEQLLAFRAPTGRRKAKEIWRIEGRSQSTGWPNCRYGPVIADLNGDGGRQIIYATKAPSGCARIVIADLAGREVWHHDFTAIPGDPPPGNVGGLILWQVGHFTDEDRMDVLATIRRSMMHSEETILLSGRNGQRIWHRERQIQKRGVGGTPFAIADCNGDGLDDAVCLHPSVYYILDGPTGENILARIIDYWGLPIAGNFLNNDTTSIFFGTEQETLTAVLKTDGTMVWSDSWDKSSKCMPTIGNFSGSGKMEAIGIGYPDGIRCYNTSTGHVSWCMPLPDQGAFLGTASADIDSDGYDEALVVIGNSIFCIGMAKRD